MLSGNSCYVMGEFGFYFPIVRCEAGLSKLCEAQPHKYSLYGHAYTQKLMYIYQSKHAYVPDRYIY